MFRQFFRFDKWLSEFERHVATVLDHLDAKRYDELLRYAVMISGRLPKDAQAAPEKPRYPYLAGCHPLPEVS